jgi:hypothetical protein
VPSFNACKAEESSNSAASSISQAAPERTATSHAAGMIRLQRGENRLPVAFALNVCAATMKGTMMPPCSSSTAAKCAARAAAKAPSITGQRPPTLKL